MKDLLEIDKIMLEFLGGKVLYNDPDHYEFQYKTSEGKIVLKSFYATKMHFYSDFGNLMKVLDYIERLGYSSIIQDETCTIIPKIFAKIRVTHTERRDTKHWATYHCIHNFIQKYKAQIKKGDV